jgi:peptidyl-prolyl cis-trans isomerase A (cyclophilin A)
MIRAALALTCAIALGACAAKPQYVQLDTTMGDIVLKLDPARAPVSTKNFLRYVDDGAYDGTIFHRVVPGFVVQGGGHLPDLRELPGRQPIENEWTNGLKNVRGSIGMARETEPDSATRQWYINVADNARLDTARDVTGNAGYAVFGHVVRGMDVVDRIEAAPTHQPDDSEHEHVPIEPIVITAARRVPEPTQ